MRKALPATWRQLIEKCGTDGVVENECDIITRLLAPPPVGGVSCLATGFTGGYRAVPVMERQLTE